MQVAAVAIVPEMGVVGLFKWYSKACIASYTKSRPGKHTCTCWPWTRRLEARALARRWWSGLMESARIEVVPSYPWKWSMEIQRLDCTSERATSLQENQPTLCFVVSFWPFQCVSFLGLSFVPLVVRTIAPSALHTTWRKNLNEWVNRIVLV